MARFLTAYPELTAGFSQASDGTMSLSGGFPRRQAFLTTQGLTPDRVIHAGLIHGARTVVVGLAHAGQVINQTDGLITAEADLGLAMTAADCFLIWAYDPVHHVIGLVHAGSRGLAQWVVAAFCRTWWRTFASDPHDVVVVIGPGICQTHYPVSRTQAAAFSAWPTACRLGSRGVHLDLRGIAEQQLIGAGIQPEHITHDDRCTAEDPGLFSYRRDRPPVSQLQVGYIVRR